MGQQLNAGGPHSNSPVQKLDPAPAQYPSAYVGRFAPSPTGPLHFGSLIAAVGSYLQARVASGAWFIRIEDLDAQRVVPGATDDIIRTLAEFGFEWQGAVEHQSQRLHRYEGAIAQLRAHECVYACSCSRAQIAAAPHPVTSGLGFDSEEVRYAGTCRHRTLPHDSATSLRFIVPPGLVSFVDQLQGPQTHDVAASSGDFVVLRRDGIFAYHLAVVVDDAAQGVTEVVRGGDLLASTPRHILLQQALGVATPAYVHLPLAVDRAGRKLSKSMQSVAIVASNASELLWQALESLRQSPPTSLHGAPTKELWAWAVTHWSPVPLLRQTECAAPVPPR